MEESLATASLAEVEAEAGNVAAAVAHYREALRVRTERSVWKHPLNFYQQANWHRCLGKLLQGEGRPEDAAKHYLEAHELGEGLVRDHPKVAEYEVEFALCCLSCGGLREASDPDASRRFYRQADERLVPLTAAFPGVPRYREMRADTLFRLGRLAHVAGRAQEATDLFQEAKQLFIALNAEPPGGGPGPGAPGANENQFAWFLATCPDESFRDPAQAVVLARMAVTRAPARWDYWNTLGAACYRAGDPAEAVKALQKAVELHTGDATDWFYLALAHQRLGQTEKARASYDRAVAWVEAHKAGSSELRLLRAEAAARLNVAVPAPSGGAPRKEG
jgi:tetratricopeptide (TPR) repeat protein